MAIAGLAAIFSLTLLACSNTDSAPGGGSPTAVSQAGAAMPASGTSSAAAPAGGATQTSEGGQVTVAVTWPGPGAEPVFSVVMDTHSVDLDAYDLQQLAVLRTDQGREVRPARWDAPKGSHHRQGTLTFPATTADGNPIVGPTTRSVELVIRDVAGVPERTFRWKL